MLKLDRVSFAGALVAASALAFSPVAFAEDAASQDHVVSVQLAAAWDDTVGENDPIEGLNRAIFGFNEAFMAMFLRPMTEIYEGLMPPPLRIGVGNMLDNLKSPVILANDILQGEGNRAWTTVQRMAINTTYGVGGFVDRAAEMGIAGHNEDFGQTLAVWGVGEGFYLVLPLLGPSNPRDAVGKILVDSYFDPLGMYLANTDRDGAQMTRTALEGMDEYGSVMNELDQIKKTSIDYYAAIRSMYRQKRSSEISNGSDIDLPPIPDFGYELRGIESPNLATAR